MGVTLLGYKRGQNRAERFSWADPFCPSLYPKSVTPIYNYVYIIYMSPPRKTKTNLEKPRKTKKNQEKLRKIKKNKENPRKTKKNKENPKKTRKNKEKTKKNKESVKEKPRKTEKNQGSVNGQSTYSARTNIFSVILCRSK